MLGFALFAVLALTAVTAASASAVTFSAAEWLVGGNPVTGKPGAEITGELLLEETVLGIKLDALCSGILVGTIGPSGEGTITELLNLAKEAINKEELVELGLLCTSDSSCGTEPLAWAKGLPWKTLLQRMVDGTETFFVNLLENASYHVDCMNNTSDTCSSADSVAKVTNLSEGLDAEFTDAFTELAELKLANCTLAGNEKGIVEGLGFVTTAGGALTAS